MPRFLLHSLLFLLIGMVPAWLITQYSIAHPPATIYSEQPTEADRLRAILSNLNELEALSLGSSHARSLDFDELGLVGQDLGLPWNDVPEIEFQARTLSPRMPALRVVFISLSYFSFHWDNAHGAEDALLTSRRFYYGSTPFLGWIRGDLDNFVVGKTQPLARDDNWYLVAAQLLGRDERQEQQQNYYEDMLEDRDSEQLVEHAGRRVPRTVEIMHVMLESNPDLPRQNYATLSSAIRRLQERGVRVVLFTPPYYAHYRALYARQPTLGEMRRLAARLSAEHAAEYYDFSDHAMSMDPTNFRDSDHLNPRGRTHFSRVLAAAMRDAAPADASPKP